MSNHLIEGVAGIAVPTRLTQRLLLAVALSGTGVAIVALSQGVPAPRPMLGASATPALQGLNTGDAPTLLPEIVVKPDAGIVTLATITVHPDRTGTWTPATERSGDYTVGAKKAEDPATRATASLAGGNGFDMPYYSFGRSAHHASKE